MPRDDEDRVFDISKPQRTGPSPTSRPIIIGHHPMMSDPMVNDANQPPQPVHAPMPSQHKSIPVLGMDSHNETPAAPPPPPPPVVAEHPESVVAAVPLAPGQPGVPGADNPAVGPPAADMHLASLDDVIGHDGPHHSHHHDHSQPAGTPPPPGKPRKSGKKGLWFLLLLLLIVVGAYLAIDSRLIKTSIKLPFHVFKQPAPAASTNTPVVTTPATIVPAIPAGFAAYALTGTPLSFDYPTVWGTPAITDDPGFSTRSTTAKSDGTYAYLVNFATNKDVQIAVTSSKYLPVTRAPLYYDYLQWCVGSADGKIYKSEMHFTTADKVDTPSTVTCDQGPLTDAAKLNSFTIVQDKTTNPDGSALGDLYTVNLKETDLPVLRVKDATSANSVDIKQLLATIKSSDSTQ